MVVSPLDEHRLRSQLKAPPSGILRNCTCLVVSHTVRVWRSRTSRMGLPSHNPGQYQTVFTQRVLSLAEVDALVR